MLLSTDKAGYQWKAAGLGRLRLFPCDYVIVGKQLDPL